MHSYKNQKGVTLLELMVGIAIGLMVIATALGALMIARGFAGTTNEANQLQQQASFISRMIGRQIRQAGGLQLSIDFGSSNPSNLSIFDESAILKTGFSSSIPLYETTLPNGNIRLESRYLTYSENIYSNSGPVVGMQFADCLGEGTSSDTMLTSIFQTQITDTSTGMRTLSCTGKSGVAQPVADNLLDFRLSYIYQQSSATGAPAYKVMSASQMAGITAANNKERWADVVAVNVCMILVGSERIDTAGAQYQDCSDTSISMNNRLIKVFKSTYNIRTQGAPL